MGFRSAASSQLGFASEPPGHSRGRWPGGTLRSCSSSVTEEFCHLELPAHDMEASAAFYERVFGWHVRRDRPAFRFGDSTGEVSRHWVQHRASSEPGLLVYLMVADVAAAIERVVSEGWRWCSPSAGTPGRSPLGSATRAAT